MINVKISDILDFLASKSYIFSFEGNREDEIEGFSSLFNYRENTMTFVSSLNSFEDYAKLFQDKKIKLVILSPKEKSYDCFLNVIKIESPKNAFFSIIENFFVQDVDDEFQVVTMNNKSTIKFSYVSDNAVIGNNVKIGKGCIIEGNVSIGDNTVIHHNVVIRANTKIGKCCNILSGTVIGERGFNPLKTSEGSRNLVKHYGGVIIEDYVDIGENCCISKGTIDDTIIKKGVKINKSAVIAHNVIIGENTVITSPVFIAGSVVIGKGCHIAASVIRNQCRIGDGAILGLGAVVVKDVEPGITVVGNPAKKLIK